MPGEAELAARLVALQRSEALALASSGGAFLAPRSVPELAEAVLANPDAWLLGGGTDIGLWITKALQTSATIIYTGEVAALKSMTDERMACASARRSFGGSIPRHEPRLPELAQVWTRFIAPDPVQRRSAATSPTARRLAIQCPRDGAARVVLRRRGNANHCAGRPFYVDCKKQSRRPGRGGLKRSCCRHDRRPRPASLVAAYKELKAQRAGHLRRVRGVCHHDRRRRRDERSYGYGGVAPAFQARCRYRAMRSSTSRGTKRPCVQPYRR